MTLLFNDRVRVSMRGDDAVIAFKVYDASQGRERNATMKLPTADAVKLAYMILEAAGRAMQGYGEGKSALRWDAP